MQYFAWVEWSWTPKQGRHLLDFQDLVNRRVYCTVFLIFLSPFPYQNTSNGVETRAFVVQPHPSSHLKNISDWSTLIVDITGRRTVCSIPATSRVEGTDVSVQRYNGDARLTPHSLQDYLAIARVRCSDLTVETECRTINVTLIEPELWC